MIFELIVYCCDGVWYWCVDVVNWFGVFDFVEWIIGCDCCVGVGNLDEYYVVKWVLGVFGDVDWYGGVVIVVVDLFVVGWIV